MLAFGGWNNTQLPDYQEESDMQRNDQPYPFRNRNGWWEVVQIHDGNVVGYIRCESEEDAVSVADARPLNYLSMIGVKTSLDRVQRSRKALGRSGWDARQLLVRRLMHLESLSSC